MRWSGAFIFLAAAPSLVVACPNTIHQSTLETGLTVYHVETHMPASGLLHMFWLGSGSVDDPPEKSGAAHMLEHLVARRDVKDGLEDFGTYGNAATSFHYTVYWEHFAAEHVERVMKMRANSLAPANFDQAMIDRERSVVLSEKYGDLESNPLSEVYLELQNRMYGEKGYGTPVIGREQDLLQISPDDVNAYFAKHYNPKNAFVLLIGNIEPESAVELTKQAYANFGKSNENAVFEGPKLLVDRYIRAWATDRELIRDDRRAYSKKLLAFILGGDGTTGRLYDALVVKRGLATSVGVSYKLNEPGFYIYGRPLQPADQDDLDQAVLEQIEQLGHHGPSAQEMEISKKHILSEWLFSCDALLGAGFTIGEDLVQGIDPDSISIRENLIDALKPEDVKAAAQDLLSNLSSYSAYVNQKHSEEN